MRTAAKGVDDQTSRLHRISIGFRLTICFVLIILAMLVGNVVLLWQFRAIRAHAERLSGVDQQFIAVLQAHANLLTFYERLDALARSEDTARLVKEVEDLKAVLLENNRRSMSTLSRLPPEAQLDPTLLPTLTAAMNIGQAQQRILLIVPATAVLTLLFAALLGLAITRSITQPLRRLMEASQALGRGDFQNRVAVIGTDEFSHLGRVFNDTALTLRDLYDSLSSREAYLAEAQKLSHTGSFGWNLSTGELVWSDETRTTPKPTQD